jgi:hypothetical protein
MAVCESLLLLLYKSAYGVTAASTDFNLVSCSRKHLMKVYMENCKGPFSRLLEAHAELLKFHVQVFPAQIESRCG